MHERVFAIITVFLALFLIVLQAEATQSEGPNINPPDGQTTSAPEIIMVQPTAQQNTTNLDQTPNTSLRNLNIEVASDVYSDKDRQVLCCPKGNYMVVRNRIYLEGADLDKIKEVKYFLHETFDQPEGVMGDSANNFEIWIWSWGGFWVRAVITTKTGYVFEKNFNFTFKSKFEEAQNKEIPRILRCYE